MEYKIGQELHIGSAVSGIIFYVNETQVTMMNWNGETKTYYKDFLNEASRMGENYFFLSDEVTDSLKEVYDEAMRMNELITKFSSVI